MTRVLEIRERIILLFKTYEKLIMPILKFILGLFVFMKLNATFGSVELLNKPLTNVLLALLMVFLPTSWVLFLIVLLIMGQMILLSIEGAVVIGLLMFVAYIVFVRLFPEMSGVILAIPILYFFNLQYAIPLFIGLFVGPAGLMAALLGVAVVYVAKYLNSIFAIKAASLMEMQQTLITTYKYVLNTVLKDRDMVITVVVFILVVGTVYFVSRLNIDYARYISILSGGALNIILFIVLRIALKGSMSILGIIFFSLITTIIVLGMEFFHGILDYSRTEKVQFEDDDYYYYVKAVPKIRVSKKTKSVKTI